jgi:hypothetical protein
LLNQLLLLSLLRLLRVHVVAVPAKARRVLD